MKKIFTLIATLSILIMSVFTFVGCSDESNSLVVYTEAGFAPFEYMQGTDVIGADIDIAKQIAKKLNKNLIVKTVAFDAISEAVKQNPKNSIGLAGLTDRTATDPIEGIKFSSHYFTSQQYILTNKGVITSTDSKAGMAALSNKKIGVQLGTTGNSLVQKSIDDNVLSASTTIVPNEKFAVLVQQLSANAIDAIVLDYLPAQSFGSTDADFEIIEITGVEVESYGAIVAESNAELLATVNAVITKLFNDGSIDTFINYHTINALLYTEQA